MVSKNHRNGSFSVWQPTVGRLGLKQNHGTRRMKKRKREIGDIDFASIWAISSNMMNPTLYYSNISQYMSTFLLIYLYDRRSMYSIITSLSQRCFCRVCLWPIKTHPFTDKVLIWVCHIRIYIPSISLEHNFRPHTIGLSAGSLREPPTHGKTQITELMEWWAIRGIRVTGLQHLVFPDFFEQNDPLIPSVQCFSLEDRLDMTVETVTCGPMNSSDLFHHHNRVPSLAQDFCPSAANVCFKHGFWASTELKW